MSPKLIKIAYFIDRLIHGGTELQLIEQINRLEGKGVKQTLFCLHETAEQHKIDIACPCEVLDIHHLRDISNLRKIGNLVNGIKKRKIDIVQTYFFDATCIGVLCGKLAGVKVIVSCRRDMGFWYTPKLLLCLKLMNKFTDHILVNSQAVKENVARREQVSLDKIDVINNGIDTSKYRFNKSFRAKARNCLRIRQDDFTVGIIANMSRKIKRVDLFIKAASLISSNVSRVRFLVLGDGLLRNELENLAESYGLKSIVSFLGRNFDKRLLLAALDVGVNTSDSEGLSNSVMEYMASGVPVIASDILGNRELIEDNKNGLLFKKGDAKDLSEKILYLVENGDLRKRLTEKGLEHIRGYDWGTRDREIYSYYKRIIQQRNV